MRASGVSTRPTDGLLPEEMIFGPNMTDKQIVKQAKKAEKEIEQGKTVSNEDAYAQFKKW